MPDVATLQIEFGKRLREIRQERGLTQGQLATLLKIKQSTLSDLEKGLHAPTLETVEHVAKTLRIAPAELF